MTTNIQASRSLVSAQEQMHRLFLPTAREVSKTTPLIFDLAYIVSQYCGLDSSLTNWYTALERLEILPKTRVIEPLPENIDEILDLPSPTHKGRLKADGTFYKIKEVGVLYLVTPESFRELEKREKAYWKDRTFARGRDIYGFTVFSDGVTTRYGITAEPTYRWVWMTKTVLPGSAGITTGPEMIEKLKRESCIKYEVPSIKDALPIQLLHRAATGETLYKDTFFNERTNDHEAIHTYLKESDPNFGFFTMAGSREGFLVVDFHRELDLEVRGYGVVCKGLKPLQE